MHLETTATDITWTGYKCMNELSENIIAKLNMFPAQKTSRHCSQKLVSINQYLL